MVAGRQRVYFLNETFRARLHNNKLIVVITDIGWDRLAIIQRSAVTFAFLTRVLDLRGVNAYSGTAFIIIFIRIFWHQIHIHKR